MSREVITDGRLLSGVPSNILRGIVPTATLWDGQVGFAYLDDGGAFTDDTTDANSAAANDVPLMPAVPVLNDAFYFGENFSTSGPFNTLKINLGTAGVGGTVAWEYYDTDTTWKAIPGIVDGTNGFTTAGAALYVTWTIPATMQHVAVNGQDRYWVRARVLTAFAPIPLATQIWLGRYPTSLSKTTDGDITTTADDAVVLRGTIGAVGRLAVDMGVQKSIICGIVAKVWSSAGTVNIFVNITDLSNPPANDINISDPVIGIASATKPSTLSSSAVMGTGRYIHITIYGSAAMTAFCEIFEIKAFEVGA